MFNLVGGLLVDEGGSSAGEQKDFRSTVLELGQVLRGTCLSAFRCLSQACSCTLLN